MQSVSVNNFKDNIYKYLDNIVSFGNPLSIVSDNKKAVILSEEDYNSLIESSYLNSIPTVKSQIECGLIADDEDFEEFKW